MLQDRDRADRAAGAADHGQRAGSEQERAASGGRQCPQVQALEQRDAEVADQPLMHREYRARRERNAPRPRSCRRRPWRRRVPRATAPASRSRPGSSSNDTSGACAWFSSQPVRISTISPVCASAPPAGGARRSLAADRGAIAQRTAMQAATSSNTPRLTIGPILSMPQRVAPLVLRVPCRGSRCTAHRRTRHGTAHRCACRCAAAARRCLRRTGSRRDGARPLRSRRRRGP